MTGNAAKTAKPKDGVNRAAVLLLSLGEQEAAAILKHMNPKEVQKVGAAMANLNNISRAEVAQVLSDFQAEVDEKTALGVGNDDFIRNMLVQALGQDKADNLIDRILLGRNSKGLEALKWMNAKSVAETIRLEHPQIMAIVLSSLESDHAAEVLSYLPENVRVDLLMRISVLDGVQPSALNELDDILEKQFAGNSNVKSSHVGGVKIAADILNFMDTSLESELIEKIAEADDDLSQQIQDLMFVFDNLVDVDDRGIQALLREVSTDDLITALKGADEPVKNKIFKNMSKRAAETLRDDLEAKGPVRVSEVEAAQKEILVIARRMAESGDLVLNSKGGEEFV
jgi:flagellar motor switch protein FliG